MWVIAGLGNPGFRYRWNRHNIGFFLIDLLAKRLKVKLRKDKLVPAFIGNGMIGGEEALLVKPATYMNRSGIAVRGLAELYGLNPNKILVVSDDLDLVWDKIRIRKSGSSAGHKGVESIIIELGTTNFPRLRMGVGRPSSGGTGIIEHVLGNFTGSEKEELDDYCKRAADAVYAILSTGIDVAMNKFN